MWRGKKCRADNATIAAPAAAAATSSAARTGVVVGTAARDGAAERVAVAASAVADADTTDADEEHERGKQTYDDVLWSTLLQRPHVGYQGVRQKERYPHCPHAPLPHESLTDVHDVTMEQGRRYNTAPAVQPVVALPSVPPDPLHYHRHGCLVCDIPSPWVKIKRRKMQ